MVVFVRLLPGISRGERFANNERCAGRLPVLVQPSARYNPHIRAMEPGQTVIPHGPDRDLTIAEVLPERKRL